ncbi:hypothetical protein GCM10009760_23120 [Kitasatospora kazusensis]|uniref:Integral membrane protein n=1 Tax=Kitasatospora kazusensis TaxID=407974 RepID=A0ABN2ZCJ0_9ACTN
MSTRNADSGDAFVRAGAIVFGFGAVATLVTFVPLFFDLPRLPTIAYWLCMLMPLGFLCSLTGMLLSARAQRRRVKEAAQPA